MAVRNLRGISNLPHCPLRWQRGTVTHRAHAVPEEVFLLHGNTTSHTSRGASEHPTSTWRLPSDVPKSPVPRSQVACPGVPIPKLGHLEMPFGVWERYDDLGHPSPPLWQCNAVQFRAGVKQTVPQQRCPSHALRAERSSRGGEGALRGHKRLTGCSSRGFLGTGVVVLLLPLVNT